MRNDNPFYDLDEHEEHRGARGIFWSVLVGIVFWIAILACAAVLVS